MIANNQELIHCEALSHHYLSLPIRGLTSTFAADEGGLSSLKLKRRKSDGDGALILDVVSHLWTTQSQMYVPKGLKRSSVGKAERSVRFI